MSVVSPPIKAKHKDFFASITEGKKISDFHAACVRTPIQADTWFANGLIKDATLICQIICTRPGKFDYSPFEIMLNRHPVTAAKWIRDIAAKDLNALISMLNAVKLSREPLIVKIANKPRAMRATLESLKGSGHLLKILRQAGDDGFDAMQTCIGQPQGAFGDLRLYLLKSAPALYFQLATRTNSYSESALSYAAKSAPENFMQMATDFVKNGKSRALVAALVKQNKYGMSPLANLYCYHRSHYDKLMASIPNLVYSLKTETDELALLGEVMSIKGVTRAAYSRDHQQALAKFIQTADDHLVQKALGGVHFGLSIYDIVDSFPPQLRFRVKVKLERLKPKPEFNLWQNFWRCIRWLLGQVSWQVPALTPEAPEISKKPKARHHVSNEKIKPEPVIFREKPHDGVHKPVSVGGRRLSSDTSPPPPKRRVTLNARVRFAAVCSEQGAKPTRSGTPRFAPV